MRCRIFVLAIGLGFLLGPAVNFSQGQKGPPGGGRTKTKGGPPGGGGMEDVSSFKGKGKSKGKDSFSFSSMGPGSDTGGPDTFSRDGGPGGSPASPFGRETFQPGMSGRPGSPPPIPGLIADGRSRRDEGRPGFGADSRFRVGDQNGDGVLSFNELDEVLRNERDRWDQNGDGFIDAPEYAAFYQARLLQWQAEREMNGDRMSEDSRGMSLDLPQARRGAARPPAVTEEGRPVVYSAGHLPRDLPGWFRERDRNGDAQVSLFEWRQGGQSPNDFKRYDSDDDGFITAEELLRAIWAEQDRSELRADVRVIGPLISNRASGLAGWPPSGSGFGTRGGGPGPGGRMASGPPGGGGNSQGRGGRGR